MRAITTATPTNTSHSWCDSAAIAMMGNPTAVTSGHHDPPGTWIGAGGVAGRGVMGAWGSVCHSGSRLATRGITVQLPTRGGYGIATSRGAPFRRSLYTHSQRRRLSTRSTYKH